MPDLILPDLFELRTEYVGLTEALQDDLTARSRDLIDNMRSSYLKKYIDKPDAEVHFHLRVSKVDGSRFEGKFNATLDGELFHWNTSTPFKEPFDIVSHAFKHLKEHLANK